MKKVLKGNYENEAYLIIEKFITNGRRMTEIQNQDIGRLAVTDLNAVGVT